MENSFRVGRAKRGASGALYLQSATAGRMSAPGSGWSGRIGQAVLKVGSCATGFYEPGQTLTGAALRRIPCVPRGRLAGVGCPALTWLVALKGGLHGLFIFL